jgi:hypothetical protein
MDQPNVVEWAQRQLTQYGRVGSTRIMRVPALATAIAAGAAVEATAPVLNFPKAGTVIAMYGQERTGTVAKFATTEVRVQFSGSEDLVSDGNAGEFAPMLGLFGPNVNWFPLMRRVTKGISWTVSYRNTDTGATATPIVMFGFIADDDLARIQARRR